jgi:two-component system sensor histidine kinase PilS (NtrC family)
MVSASLPAKRSNLSAREQYFFALFRCLEAALLALWVFSPFAPYFNTLNTQLPLKLLSVTYLLFSSALFLLDKRGPGRNRVLPGLVIDMLMFACLAWLLPVGFFSVALVMLANLAAGGLLLTSRQSTLVTLAAIAILLGQYLFNVFSGADQANIAQSLMFAASYSATVLFCQMLAKQAQQSMALAEERGQQLADMAQMNELIITRMRTGVILLDKHHRIVLSNEAANQLSQKNLERGHSLQELEPELDRRLWQWRQNPDEKPQALVLYEHGPEVIPRFVALTQQDVLYLAFLEDSRVFSGRADELQLANLGRLSASIAHEIRNPLAAISYAQQLLAESEHVPEADRRLLDIIGIQSQRMNGIIENVLQLAKREAAHPESIELNAFCERFVQEFLATHPQEQGKIALHPHSGPAVGLFDPLHLYQVLSVLLTNALHYGHNPYQAAHIQIALRMDAGQPHIDVIDHGPGIRPEDAKHLFTPFFSTSEHGTGLGLYIARQLAEANQGQLRYEPLLGGGCRFTLVLSGGHSLLAEA